MFRNFFFGSSANLLTVDHGKDASCWFSVSFGFRLVWSTTPAPLWWEDFLSPLAIIAKGVLVMPARLPVLTRSAIWQPRVIVRTLALTDFAGMFPVAYGTVVTTSGAC